MTPRDALAEGNLTLAIALQQDAVAAAPTSAAARLFLFELFTVAGRLREANENLAAVASSSDKWPAVRRGFERILRAEYRRTHRHRRPEFLKPPSAHVRRRWRMTEAVAQQNFAKAAQYVDSADTASPRIGGHVDGREFDGLRDTDDRFGSVFEVFLKGEYAWIPFEHVRKVRLAKAKGVLDVIFRPARLTLAAGEKVNAILPLTYPGSHAAIGVLALGRETDWPEAGGLAVGLGARVLMAGEEVVELGAVTQLELRPA